MSKIFDDLFPAQKALERIPLEDAEVYYFRELPFAQTAEAVMNQLIDEVPWRAENIVVWGKTYPQPRLIAWYGDNGMNYTYSGIPHDPLPWTHTLTDIKNRVENIAGTNFNSVLLNYYRSHRKTFRWARLKTHRKNTRGLTTRRTPRKSVVLRGSRPGTEDIAFRSSVSLIG